MIKLLEKTVSKSGTGFETRNTTAGREIIAEQGGVGRSEFYKAAAAGMTEADYQQERLIEYNGKTYKVLRSYPTPNRKVELVCQGGEPNDD